MTESLLKAVMALPPEERAQLAEQLWESLPNENADTDFDEDLALEVRSRREQHLQQGSPLHDWPDVRKELDGIIARFDKS